MCIYNDCARNDLLTEDACNTIKILGIPIHIHWRIIIFLLSFCSFRSCCCKQHYKSSKKEQAEMFFCHVQSSDSSQGFASTNYASTNYIRLVELIPCHIGDKLSIILRFSNKANICAYIYND